MNTKKLYSCFIFLSLLIIPMALNAGGILSITNKSSYNIDVIKIITERVPNGICKNASKASETPSKSDRLTPVVGHGGKGEASWSCWYPTGMYLQLAGGDEVFVNLDRGSANQSLNIPVTLSKKGVSFKFTLKGTMKGEKVLGGGTTGARQFEFVIEEAK